MAGAPSNIAIILHGPPAMGKSQVWEEIYRLHPNAARISLDDGWAPGEQRFAVGSGRYADLAQSPSPILVVELGWGEPVGLNSSGATRAADEWINVLRSAGRVIYPFFLWAQPDEVWQRIQDRNRRRQQSIQFAIYEMGVYALYEQCNPLFTFPVITAFSETRIDTTGRQYAEVAREILQTCGL